MALNNGRSMRVSWAWGGGQQNTVSCSEKKESTSLELGKWTYFEGLNVVSNLQPTHTCMHTLSLSLSLSLLLLSFLMTLS